MGPNRGVATRASNPARIYVRNGREREGVVLDGVAELCQMKLRDECVWEWCQINV